MPEGQFRSYRINISIYYPAGSMAMVASVSHKNYLVIFPETTKFYLLLLSSVQTCDQYHWALTTVMYLQYVALMISIRRFLWYNYMSVVYISKRRSQSGLTDRHLFCRIDEYGITQIRSVSIPSGFDVLSPNLANSWEHQIEYWATFTSVQVVSPQHSIPSSKIKYLEISKSRSCDLSEMFWCGL